MEYLKLGKIIDTFSLDGTVKIFSTTTNQDIRFQKGKKVLIKIEDEYNRKHNDITQYCQIVYKNSNFLKNIIKVNEVVNVYKSRQKNSNNESEKLSHFVMYAKRAEMVQKELSEYLPQFLIKLDQMEKTKLVHNNQQSQEYSI